ncbi:MAG: hypothetical protein EBR82_24025 [Caulobacteraceae bacterium]|nr:hypothetical protein [Caulobacteraceae bacterium]
MLIKNLFMLIKNSIVLKSNYQNEKLKDRYFYYCYTSQQN